MTPPPQFLTHLMHLLKDLWKALPSQVQRALCTFWGPGYHSLRWCLRSLWKALPVFHGLWWGGSATPSPQRWAVPPFHFAFILRIDSALHSTLLAFHLTWRISKTDFRIDTRIICHSFPFMSFVLTATIKKRKLAEPSLKSDTKIHWKNLKQLEGLLLKKDLVELSSCDLLWKIAYASVPSSNTSGPPNPRRNVHRENFRSIPKISLYLNRK